MLVVWRDHCTLAGVGWVQLDDAVDMDCVICQTVGILIAETAQHYVLAQTLNDQDSVNCVTLVLKADVVSVTSLRPSPHPRRSHRQR